MMIKQLLILLLITSVCYADPFDWNDQPAQEYDIQRVVITSVANGIRAEWTPSPDAYHGYRVVLLNETLGMFQQYEKSTFENFHEQTGLTTGHSYIIRIYIRGNTEDGDSLLAETSFIYDMGKTAPLYAYENHDEGFFAGVAVVSSNAEASCPVLHVANGDTYYKHTFTLEKYGASSAMLFTLFNGMSFGKYAVWLENAHGCTLEIVQYQGRSVYFAHTVSP